ncbi:MAG TPA: FAD-binding oxidoreductase [Acetobacteraceae bacterium]|nr:FAD-binding oxidoreductase [Acetobacteraceae bacterium]
MPKPPSVACGQSLPPSLYADTAPPAPPTPPLAGDVRADVAIIGGGFTGLSAALHLAEAGAKPVVLEANAPGWGASGRNGGQVNPGLKPPPDEVERDFGPELGGRMVAVSCGAPDFVFGLIRRLGIDCAARQGGTLRAAIHPRDERGLAGLAAQQQARGMPVELLDAARMARETGTSRYRAALLDPRGGQLHPLAYVRGLAAAALAAGAAVHGGTPALRARREGGDWLVETPGGRVRAARLILATNGYTGDLWPGLRRTVVPAYSAIVATEALSPALLDGLLRPGRVLYELGEITTYYRVDAEGRLLMGGRSQSHDAGGVESFRFLTRYATRLWPALRGVGWTHGWNGQVAITEDHYPHLHAPAPGVLACLGYNGRGVAMGSVMGRELARLSLGMDPAEAALPVTPIRPFRLHRFWRAGVATHLLYGRMRDWLGL